MHYNEYTLPSGLRVIYEPTFSKVVYCGFATDTGTRNETEDEQGMAHFVEHLISEGTEKRKTWHILNHMEDVGDDLNAYADKEETIVHAAPLVGHLERALELLGDTIFYSTFPQHEVEKEAEVITDETQSYGDNPSELIFDDFEDMVFRNHLLGRDILGKPELLRSLRTEDVLSPTNRLYQPGNVIFFVQGQYDFKKIIRLAEKYLFDILVVTVDSQWMPPPLYVPERLVTPRDTYQAHVMIGSRRYNAYDDKRMASYLLNNVLGDPGMNSKLNVSLRKRRGLVYNVESNLTSYTDIGAFRIYFGTGIEDMDICLKPAYKELKRMRDVKMIFSQLAATKKQLIGQIGVTSDNFENNALGMAKICLHYHEYKPSESVLHRIEALTAEQLLGVANEMSVEEYLSMLIYK